MGAVGMPLHGSLLALAGVLAVCVPASSLIVFWVEGTRHGFTVAGASFTGFCVAPLALAAMDAFSKQLGFGVPLAPCLAALAIAYVLGEGVGRLACISFGCCYGKPVEEARGWVRRFSRRHHFVFTGSTKKIAFSSGLDGVPVVPVQAMTATVHGLTTLIALWLYCEGHYEWVLPTSMATTQVWRIYSETFRADFRGSNGITAYQIMAAVMVAASLAAPAMLARHAGPPASLLAGLAALWRPETLVLLHLV